MIIGKDEHAKVMLVMGREKRFKAYAEEGWKIIPLKGTIRALTFSRVARTRPVHAGLSIGQADITAGTSGGVVFYQNERHGISNSHIVTDHPELSSPPSRLEILQPAPYDGGKIPEDVIGYYVKHAKISVSEKSFCNIARIKDSIYNRTAGILNRGTRSFSFTMLQEEENYIDAGVYEPINPNVISEIIIDNTGSAIPIKYMCGLLFAGSSVDNIMVASRADYIEKLLGVQFLYDIKIPEQDEIIYKSGRSTELTFGNTLATDMTTTVDYGSGVAVMKHCIVAEVKCAGGDSGSPVFVPKD